VLDQLESNQALDGWSEKVVPVLSKVLQPEPMRDVLTGRWLGHPLHPALVAVPIGCWVSAGMLDLLGGRGGGKAAERLIALGILSAVPTAAAGAADWIDTAGAEQRVGLVHALSNSVALVMYTASWSKRRKGQRLRGMALSTIGFAAVSVGGWLGGHLVYRRGLGVTTTAFQSGPEEWTPVMDVDQLREDEPAAARVGSVVLLLVRRNGGVHVLENRCTHRGGPLHEGQVEGDCVRCPWHASTFRLRDGSVVTGPATAPQPSYEARVRDGKVEVRRREEGDLRRGAQDSESSISAPALSSGS
jgi:nitrite reductase/ring-hydroxylating ferredoxin subunit/uncharacterized membrane protein